ncbi:MAG: hypothetical protein DRJ03_31635 [Chloroflexi bacterium]|nr:MAG: hypothetical protein DRJ03_31635 [Chloroflexota bacterium]
MKLWWENEDISVAEQALIDFLGPPCLLTLYLEGGKVEIHRMPRVAAEVTLRDIAAGCRPEVKRAILSQC